MQEVFKKLILHYPADALEKIEEVSYLLKHQQASGLKVEDFLQLEEIHNYSQAAQTLQGYIDKMQGSTKKVKSGLITFVIEACRRGRRGGRWRG